MPNGGMSAYWAKRAGGFYDPKSTKGISAPNGNIVKLKRGGYGPTSNSVPKRKSIAKVLADNAFARKSIKQR